MPRPAAPTSHPTRFPVGSAAAPVYGVMLELGGGPEAVPFEGVLEVVVERLETADGGSGGAGGDEEGARDEGT